MNGAFTRYVVVRPDQLYRVLKGFALLEATLSESFAATVLAVTEVTRVRIGETALISGPNPNGLLCLKLLVAEGLKTIVAGAAGDGVHLEALLQWGATRRPQSAAARLHYRRGSVSRGWTFPIRIVPNR